MTRKKEWCWTHCSGYTTSIWLNRHITTSQLFLSCPSPSDLEINLKVCEGSPDSSDKKSSSFSFIKNSFSFSCLINSEALTLSYGLFVYQRLIFPFFSVFILFSSFSFYERISSFLSHSHHQVRIFAHPRVIFRNKIYSPLFLLR